MSHDAAHCKDAAKAALCQVEDQLASDRLMREKQLSDRRALWRIKQDMRTSAEMTKLPITSDSTIVQAGGAAGATERHWQSCASAGDDGSRISDEYGGMSLEVALRKIKEVTGVSDVDDVIKKFSSQSDTAKNLASMTHEAQARIDGLALRIDAARLRVEELRYSSAMAPAGAAAGQSRRVVDDTEMELTEAMARHERLQARQERVARLIVSVRAGAEHMSEQLELVDLPNEIMTTTLTNRAHTTDAVSSLALSKLKLRHVLHELREEEAASRTALADPECLASLVFPAAAAAPPLPAAGTAESGAEIGTLLLPALPLEKLQLLADATDELDAETDEEGGEGVTERQQLKARSCGVTGPVGSLRAVVASAAKKSRSIAHRQ